MRLFLAIDLPDPLKAKLEKAQSALTGGRRVPRDNLHLTVLFLGDELSLDAAEQVDMELRARALPKAEIVVAGIGHFGHDAPRAIWAGVAKSEGLVSLHEKCRSAARRAGCETPKRRFVPHVTLARYGSSDMTGHIDLATMLGRHGQMSYPAFTASELVLYRSHFGRAGPAYEPLASYDLS